MRQRMIESKAGSIPGVVQVIMVLVQLAHLGFCNGHLQELLTALNMPQLTPRYPSEPTVCALWLVIMNDRQRQISECICWLY